MSDHRRSSREPAWDAEPESEVVLPRVAPGKRTLTGRLPPRPGTGRAAPVQRRRDAAAGTRGHGDAAGPAGDASPAGDSGPAGDASPAGGADRWLDAAVRPDLFPAAVQRKASGEDARGAGGAALPSAGAGRALSEEVRARMEGSLGMDFSAVRVHEGLRARALGALAYTEGTDIHFAPGQYQPDSPGGQELLGHELAHVVQQSRGRVAATTQARGVAVNDDAGLEREADELGARAARGEPAPAAAGTAPPRAGAVQRRVVQRQDDAGEGGEGEAASPVEQVREALEDDEADTAISRMGGLDAAGASEVLRRFQAEAVSCFDNDSMARAARVLVARGGPLNRALEWQLDEGTSADDILATVRACTSADHKREVRTASWLERFSGELGNDEMAQLVELLDGGLAFELEWMAHEGTDWAAIQAKISACTDDAQKAALRNDTWKVKFCDDIDLGNEQIAELVDLLGGDLAFKLDWMAYEGTDWAAIQAKITAVADDAQKAALRNDTWKVRFCDDVNLGNDEIAELVDALGGTLRFKFGWMLYEGTDLDALRTRARAADPADRQTVWSDAAFMTELHDELGEQDYLDLVVALEMFQPGTTAEDGANHTSAADADAAVQTHLAAYVADAVRDGRQISGLVAVVGGDDWDRAGIAHYGESTWNGGKSTSINGFVDSEGRVWIEKDSGNAGTMIHEAVHKYSVRELIGISQPLNEGVTEYFTRVICAALAPPITGRGNYQSNYDCVVDLVALVGEATVAAAYFDGDTDGLEDAFVTAKSEADWDTFIAHTEANEWAQAAALCAP